MQVMDNKLTAIIADDEVLARDIIKEFLRKHELIEVVAEAGNGIEAVNLVNEFTPDILFLDVQMPELSGLDALKELDDETLPLTVFTTAYDKYALKAFEASAIDYLLKPFDQERFDIAIERAKKYLYSIDKNYRENERQKVLANYETAISGAGNKRLFLERLLVKENKKLIPVKVEDIIVFEANNDYVRLHFNSNLRKLLINRSLSSLESALNPKHFVRIHKSTIIKIDAIAEMKSHTNGEYIITLKNGMEVRLSRSYKSAVQRIGSGYDFGE